MTAPVTLIQNIEKQFLRKDPLPEFRPGDTVKVWVRIREGQKTRLQAFEGVCIRRSRGGSRASFTIRKISYGVGVERIFADASPNIDKVEVVSRGKVHQSRLYYLRSLRGKAARIKERTADRSVAAPTMPSGEDQADKPRLTRRERRKAAKAAAVAETRESSAEE